MNKRGLIGQKKISIANAVSFEVNSKKKKPVIGRSLVSDEIGSSMIAITSVAVSSTLAFSSFCTISSYNAQCGSYVSTIDSLQSEYIAQTQKYMERVRAVHPEVSNSHLRNQGNWGKVKSLVVREELMKMQMGGKAELPLNNDEIRNVKSQIAKMDLAQVNHKGINAVIDSITDTDYKKIYTALKALQTEGKVSDIFIKDSIDELKVEIKNADLSDGKQFKHLVKKYVEKTEFDHRESISSDPNKQSNADNISAVKTSEHRARHKDPETGKVNFKRPKKEPMLNRRKEIIDLNKRRVLKQNLSGLGAAVAIAAGIGFTISFLCTLAECGINPDTLQNACIAGVKASAESGIMGGVGYEIGATFGGKIAKNLGDVIIKRIGKGLAEETLKRIGQMCSMGVIGAMMIVISAVYQFAKLKHKGFSTKESLIRVGKSAAVSIVILALSIAAQGIWGGYIGLIVSVAASVTVTAIQVGMTVHEKNIRNAVDNYRLTLHMPVWEYV